MAVTAVTAAAAAAAAAALAVCADGVRAEMANWTADDDTVVGDLSIAAERPERQIKFAARGGRAQGGKFVDGPLVRWSASTITITQTVPYRTTPYHTVP